jgi:ABC-type nitrate/sulfonate/bicarbonate transport system substrate-binding protein
VKVPTRGRFAAGSAAALATIAGAALIAAAQTVPLRLNVFGGLDAWPIYVIHDRGLMSAAGYDVSSLTTTPGSVPQFAAMLAGQADIALTAMDNIVAYDSGQGDPSVSGDLDFFAFLGIGPGFLRLLVRPEVTSYDQLRGKTFAVDAPSTGFSFVLRRMLEKNGIMPGEYSFVALGSTQKRFDGMVAGQAVGGVVASPFDVIGAQKYGFHVLGNALDTLGHYQATVMMARRSWAAAHRPAIAAFVRAYRDAATWLYTPANRTEAMAILARNTDLPADIIAQITPVVLGSPASYTRDGKFDVAGVRTVMELRAAYATPKKTIGDPQAFIDQSFL